MNTKLRAVTTPTAEDIFANTSDRVVWQNVSLKDVMNYYMSVAKYILPHLRDKVQSLKRDATPKDGRPVESIFPDRSPWAEWVETVRLYTLPANKLESYIVGNNIETILYLNTIGAIEIHSWLSKSYILERPDSLVIELVAGEQNTFDDVIEVANLIKLMLNTAESTCYIKTAGVSGFHIYVPINARYDYEKVRKVAGLITEKTVDKLPNLATAERKPSLRSKSKVYVDYLQNKKGAALAAAYSIKTGNEPYVSMPLRWDEVKPGLHPSQFTIHNALKKIEGNGGDIFYPVLTDINDLNKIIYVLDNRRLLLP
jgi:bifunctional non-homologous end joining protein LigD